MLLDEEALEPKVSDVYLMRLDTAGCVRYYRAARSGTIDTAPCAWTINQTLPVPRLGTEQANLGTVGTPGRRNGFKNKLGILSRLGDCYLNIQMRCIDEFVCGYKAAYKIFYSY